MLEKGKKVGEYVLLEKLGAGGFGDVWKAEKRTALDLNYFALKFFRPKDDVVDFDKISKELTVWKQLKGLPHIISVIELDLFEDYVYVVSGFAAGGSLENWLKNNGGKARAETEAVRIALEILTGLENLHGKNFVHRDLKPDNILIMNGRYCLADFGISREIKTHSKATGTAGTMEYMPPEAFEKTPSVTPQTDIWAVGVILQRLLTGNLPYSQKDYPSLISAILMYEPREISETVSLGLREIIKKALQKKRENRFQTAREMREALENPEKFLTEIKPKISGKSAKEPSRREEAETKRFEIETKNRNETKKIAIGIVIGALAVMILGGLIWAISSNSPSNVTTTSNSPSNVPTTSNSLSNVTTSSIGMEFVKIPAGDFMMGSDKEADERPIHKVTISNDFWMSKTEVTQAQWQSVMGNNPSHFKDCSQCPVERVSWDDVQSFISKLNMQKDGYEYRLPTEAEWEYAARAGTKGDYYGNVDSIAWSWSGSKTHPVGQKLANTFGLYDMSGNVWEWCQDWYSDNYYASSPRVNPTGASSGSVRVIRGGSWFDDAAFLRSAFRNRNSPSFRNFNLGFRVVGY